MVSCWWCADPAGIRTLLPLRCGVRDPRRKPRCRSATTRSFSFFSFSSSSTAWSIASGHGRGNALGLAAAPDRQFAHHKRLTCRRDDGRHEPGAATIVVPMGSLPMTPSYLRRQIGGFFQLVRTMHVVSGPPAPPPVPRRRRRRRP